MHPERAVRVKRTALVLSVLCLLLTVLSSCRFQAGGPLDSALRYIGLDLYSYDEEDVIAEVDLNSELVQQFSDTLNILTLDTPYLTPFKGAGEAVTLYTDAILSYLATTYFSRYSGNSALLNRLSEEYPTLYSSVIIPASDYDAFVADTFGGQRISHKDGTLFRYLSKVDAYVTELQPYFTDTEIEVLRCGETELTYKFVFRAHYEELTSPKYLAIFIKREDGTCYLHQLKEWHEN